VTLLIVPVLAEVFGALGPGRRVPGA
jgi:hypothetical protein